MPQSQIQKKIQIVVLALIRKGDKYLLTLRVHDDEKHPEFNNKWQIPGGGLEFGEDPEQTLRREAREELSAELESVKFLPYVFTKVRFGNWQGLFLTYICEMKETAPITLNHEASTYGWFTADEAQQLEVLPGVNELIEKAEEYYHP